MKLTIVTTTYNQEKYIAKAIEGFLMQKTSFPFEIVISNDCSTDNTEKIIKKYQKENPGKIKLITHKKNLGAMENFIETLSSIKDTEYVALCDGDDYWTDENKLQKQVDFLDNNQDFSVCFHKARMFYEKNENKEEIIPDYNKSVSTIEDLTKENYVVANSVVYRWAFNNKDLKSIFPKDIVPGDYYVHLLHAQNGKIKMFDEVMSVYRRHEEGMWWSNSLIDKDEFNIEYGPKFLKFYNAADKYMNLPKDAFYDQRKDMIYNIIVTYVKKDKFDKINEVILSDKDKLVFSECMKEIVNRNLWYINANDELNNIRNSRWWKLRCRIKSIIKK